MPKRHDNKKLDRLLFRTLTQAMVSRNVSGWKKDLTHVGTFLKSISLVNVLTWEADSPIKIIASSVDKIGNSLACVSIAAYGLKSLAITFLPNIHDSKATVPDPQNGS